MDSKGYLYAMFGAHHHRPFKFRRSVNPYDTTQWEPVEHVGVRATYPSLVCGPDDTLFCAYRSGRRNPWDLLFQRRNKAGKWTAPQPIVRAGVKGYAQFGNSMAISDKGTIHLAYHVYDMKSPERPEGGKTVGHLQSLDGGETWETADGKEIEIPVTRKSGCFIEQDDNFDMRAVEVVLDSKGNPWVPTSGGGIRTRDLLGMRQSRRTEATAVNQGARVRGPGC